MRLYAHAGVFGGSLRMLMCRRTCVYAHHATTRFYVCECVIDCVCIYVSCACVSVWLCVRARARVRACACVHAHACAHRGASNRVIRP